MTELIFSFDTEDYTSEIAEDICMCEADTLRDCGVKGCFCVVGKLAERLKTRKRNDVITALNRHEIDFHTTDHSMHPVIDEYTDIADFEKAIALVKEKESEGVKAVKDTFGVDKLYAAVPPGNQKNYAAMYAYADMGIPIYADTGCDPEDGCGAYYCNMFHIEYCCCMESILFHWDDAQVKEILDRLATRKYAVIYTHPNMAVFSEFWDAVNYNKENKCEFGKWAPCARRDVVETAAFVRNLRKLIQTIKEDDRFTFTTYGKVSQQLAARPARKLTLADLPMMQKVADTLLPCKEGISYSAAECVKACAAFLKGETEYVPGFAKGFKEAPAGIEKPVTVKKADLIASADAISAEGFLPTSVQVGGVKLGPADWFRAALVVLAGSDTATVLPAPQMPVLDVLPKVRDAHLKGTWIHSDSFEDNYVTDGLRLQSWTFRY